MNATEPAAQFTRHLIAIPAAALVAVLVIAPCRTSVAAEPPPLVVARDTTYLTGPLDQHGEVDYVAALDKILSVGATPENNFVAAFWKIFGPRHISKDVRTEYLRRIGLPNLPEKGDYYVDDYTYRKQRHKPPEDYVEEGDFDENWATTNNPWTEHTHPWFVPWLKDQEPYLDRLVAATKLTHRYEPMLTTPDMPGFDGLFLPSIGEIHEATRSLCRRAMFRTAQGKFDAAADDLLAVRRMARLHANAAWITVDLSTGYSLDSSARKAGTAMLDQPGFTLAHVRRLQRDRKALPPLRSMAEAIDRSERLTALDYARRVRRGGLQTIVDEAKRKADPLGLVQNEEGKFVEKKPDAKWPKEFVAPFDRMLAERVDWSRLLREVNAHYDRLAAAARMPYLERRAATERLYERKTKFPSLTEILAGADRMTKDEATALLARIVIDDCRGGVSYCELSEARHLTLTRTEDLALDLAEYRLRFGSYPPTLAHLSKLESDTPRIDPFTGKAFVYRLEEEGYLLYSFGPNLRDDGGKQAYYDAKQMKSLHEDCDDMIVRMPKPNAKENRR